MRVKRGNFLHVAKD